MDFSEMIRYRRSVRKYAPTPVEPGKLQKLLEAARVAPTAANRQPVRLILVQGEEERAELGKSANIYGAPLAVIVCADREHAWKRPYDGKITTDIDASIVTDHMMLQATELGLGSVWICYFDPEQLQKSFRIPENLEPVNILAVGYPADGERPGDPNRFDKDRVSLEDLILR